MAAIGKNDRAKRGSGIARQRGALSQIELPVSGHQGGRNMAQSSARLVSSVFVCALFAAAALVACSEDEPRKEPAEPSPNGGTFAGSGGMPSVVQPGLAG